MWEQIQGYSDPRLPNMSYNFLKSDHYSFLGEGEDNTLGTG